MSETRDPVVAAPEPVATPAPESVAAASEPVVAATPEPVAPAAPVEPAQAPSLLSQPAEVIAPPAPQPVEYQPFTAPEGFTLDDAVLKPYTDILSKHGVPQEAAQELLTRYAEQQKQQQTAQLDAWARTRTDWRDKFIKDPEIGGNKQATTLARCAEVIDRFSGSAENAKELRQMLSDTGGGDHPAIIRLLNNVAKAFGEGRPVPATMAKAPAPVSTPRSRYPNSPSLPLNGAA